MTNSAIFWPLPLAFTGIVIAILPKDQQSFAVSLLAIFYVVAFALWVWLYVDKASEDTTTTDAERNAETACRLSNRNPMIFYLTLLVRLLNALDRGLTPENIRDKPDKTTKERAWNWLSFDRALLLAVAYPILSPILVFGINGSAAMLGEIEVFPEATGGLQQVVALIALTYIVLGKPIIHSLENHVFPWIYRQMRLRPATQDNTPNLQGLALIAYVIGVIGGALAVAGTYALSGAIALASVGILSGVVALAGAVVLALALAGAVAGAFVGVFAGAGSLTFAGVVFIILPLYEHFAYARIHSGKSLLWVNTVLVLALCAALIVAAYFSTFAQDSKLKTVFLFFGVFPIINALFDFVSIGFTRLALRRSIAAASWFKSALWNIADIIVGLVTFAGLIVTLILAIHGLNLVAGTPILDLGQLRNDLWGDGSANLTWIYLMVFSTLLPTAIHVGIFLLSWFVWPFNYLVKPLTRLVEHQPNHDTAVTYAVAILSCATTLLGVLAYYLVTNYTHIPALGHKYAVEMVILFASTIITYLGI